MAAAVLKDAEESMISGITDIHCHILPGVDDGSPDMETTRKMLNMAWQEGITAMVATPHHRRGYATAPVQRLTEAYAQVAQEARNIHPDFRIYLGCELFSSHNLAQKLEAGEVLSMAGTRYALIEFLPSTAYAEISAALHALQMAGYRPIVAHAERYRCLVKEPYLVEELVDMGARIQVNAGSITGKSGFSIKAFVKKLMKYEMVHFLGTDAHDMKSRSPEMQKCAAYIAKKFGEDYLMRLARDNPARMLRNEMV